MSKYGEKSSTAQIGPNDSLKKAIGYTRAFVVEQSTPHFRYDYYRDTLSRALRPPRFDPGGSPVVHLDIGCGPGVFSWVMRDHMVSNGNLRRSPVVYYGYDHCAAMIRLAQLFQKGFRPRHDFRGYSEFDEMVSALRQQDFSDCDVVVTFGYALVQVRGDPSALKTFAALIRRMFPSRSCIVVAADAYSGSMRQTFDLQCTELEAALDRSGVGLEDRVSTHMRSIMYARLNRN